MEKQFSLLEPGVEEVCDDLHDEGKGVNNPDDIYVELLLSMVEKDLPIVITLITLKFK